MRPTRAWVMTAALETASKAVGTWQKLSVVQGVGGTIGTLTAVESLGGIHLQHQTPVATTIPGGLTPGHATTVLPTAQQVQVAAPRCQTTVATQRRPRIGP